MSEFNNCQQNLLVLAKTQGYLTFDDVLDAASTSMLSLAEIDRLSDDLQTLGVMLYDTKPDHLQTDDDTYSDYSRTDYPAIFAEIISLSESLAPLIDIVQDIRPPQFGEVQSLVEQLQYGNHHARERLVLSHMRLPLKIALNISKQYSYDIEDAVSASLIGLMEAVDRFDPNGFSSFQGYASMWIQQNIHRYCNPTWLEYYCPVHVKEKIYPVLLQYNNNSGTSILCETFDMEQIRAISEKTDMSVAQIKRILKFAYNQQYGRVDIDLFSVEEDPFSVKEAPLENEEETLPDIPVSSTSDRDPFEEVCGIIMRKELEEILASLKPRECEIMRLRFGFDGPSLTLEEVGQVFDVTRERIRQIEHKCIRKLRHPSKAKRIKDFYC